MKKTTAKLGKAVVQKILASQQNACYVLITCKEPSPRGEMEVEMTYEGDCDLAAYLIDSAQSILDQPVAIAEYSGR